MLKPQLLLSFDLDLWVRKSENGFLVLARNAGEAAVLSNKPLQLSCSLAYFKHKAILLLSLSASFLIGYQDLQKQKQ
jgi:hypothetical protein